MSLLSEEAPNAFATGRGPQHAAVAATAGLIRLLDRQELAGVLVHELAHIRHRDIARLETMASRCGQTQYLRVA